MRKKKKRLFIESLEQRRSTSPLLVQTMSAGESGAIGIDGRNRGGSSAKDLAAKQAAKEGLIRAKNGMPVNKGAVIVNLEQPREIDKMVLKYGPGPIPRYKVKPNPKYTTLAIGEEGKAVKPGPIDMPLLKYGPGPTPITTLAIGEEGRPVRPDPPMVLKYGPGPTPIKPDPRLRPRPIEPIPIEKYGPGPIPGPIPIEPIPIEKYGPGPIPGNTVIVTKKVTKINDETVNEFVLRKIAELRNKMRELFNRPTERMGRNVNVSVSKGPTLKKVTLVVGEDVNNPK